MREERGEGRERGKGKEGEGTEREGVCTIGNRHPPDEILATPLQTHPKIRQQNSIGVAQKGTSAI